MTRLVVVGGSTAVWKEYLQAVRRLSGVSLVAIAWDDAPGLPIQPATTLEDIPILPWSLLNLQYPDHFDAVCIHIPLSRRCEILRQAARLGKHILVDSPIALNASDGQAMIDACRITQVQLMVGQAWKYRPSIQAVENALASGKLGRPALLRAHCWSGEQESSESETESDIKQNQMWSQIVSQIDLAMGIFGSPPLEIFALGNCLAKDKSRWPDYLQIHLAFANDGMALITISQSLPAGDTYETLSVISSSGAAYSDQHHQTQLLFRGGNPLGLHVAENVVTRSNELKQFVSSLPSPGVIPASLELPKTGVAQLISLKLGQIVWESYICREPIPLTGGSHVSFAV